VVTRYYQLGKRPFNKADFDRERAMLEDAISRVEIEATTKRITTETAPGAPVQPSDIGPTPMTPVPPVRSWLACFAVFGRTDFFEPPSSLAQELRQLRDIRRDPP
jgi:hypothetical protein